MKKYLLLLVFSCSCINTKYEDNFEQKLKRLNEQHNYFMSQLNVISKETTRQLKLADSISNIYDSIIIIK